MKSITIKDIARALGISPSTVSRALQNHPDISLETRRVVQTYAQEHNYKPNMMASNLRTARNTTIGLLIPSATHYFYARVLKGVEQVAAEAGYNIIITQSDRKPEREQQALRALLSLRVGGVLACVGNHPESHDLLQTMIDDEIPLVLVGRQAPLNCDQIVSNDYDGAFRAVEYMILSGAKRVAYYTGPLDESPAAERFRGYKDALKKYDMPLDPQLVLECYSRTDALVKTPDFLLIPNRPDAILAVNDQTAAGILESAKMLGIRVPDEMQICGFSNDMLTRHTDPMLSTVQQHAKAMGQEAMQLLITRMQEKEDQQPHKTHILPTNLIVRESTH